MSVFQEKKFSKKIDRGVILRNKYRVPNRHMHSKILTGLSLGLSFKFFEYLSFEFEFEFEFEYFANLLQIWKKII